MHDPSDRSHDPSAKAHAPSIPAQGGGGRAPLEVRHLGRIPYAQADTLQRELVDRRRRGEIGDRLLLLEHPHVVTLGSGADRSNVLASDDVLDQMGIELFPSGRGGDVTYHGPGQLVGYPILALPEGRRDLHRYLRDLEEVLIRALAALGVQGQRLEGLTGVWTGGRKIAAIGIRVSSGWITSHGFALNVDPDLRYFDVIVPCGLHDREVTSVSESVGHPVPMHGVRAAVARAFLEVFPADAIVP